MDYDVKYIRAGIFDHGHMATALSEALRGVPREQIISINHFDAGNGAHQVAFIVIAK